MLFSQTCKIIDTETNLHLGILGVDNYSDWVTSQLISLYTERIRTNQLDWLAFFNRAREYELISKYIAASNDYESANSISVDNPRALNNFALLLATSPDASVRDGKKAVIYAEKACTLTDWKRFECISALAAAWAEVGDFDKAIKYEEQAIDPTIIDSRYLSSESDSLELYKHHQPDRYTAHPPSVPQ
jgi:tetratricopeptide (TPR) repeat protein